MASSTSVSLLGWSAGRLSAVIHFFSVSISSTFSRSPLGGMSPVTATRSIIREALGSPGTTTSAEIMRDTSSTEPQPAGSAWP
jgi:hypothetical protein